VGAFIASRYLSRDRFPPENGAVLKISGANRGAGFVKFAMTRKPAVLIYRMLRWGQLCVDEGMDVYEERFRNARLKNCEEIAKQFGYNMLPTEDHPVCDRSVRQDFLFL
jgi:hypothetical protein